MANNSRVMLTTVDNPYDPFTQFDEWNAYDQSLGYNTCAYLARITISSEEISEADQGLAVEDAIDEIVKYNIIGVYRKVVQSD